MYRQERERRVPVVGARLTGVLVNYMGAAGGGGGALLSVDSFLLIKVMRLFKM